MLNTKQLSYYQINRTEILKKRAKKRKSETKTARANRLTYLKKWREENSEDQILKAQSDNSKFNQYKFSAKRRNHIFELDYETFKTLFHSKCSYCGDKESRGIDRIDNKIGYTKENSEPCCEMCNKMKWKWTRKEFIEKISKIHLNA